MTGYGKAEAILETGKITVEVRSLNGKTADISIKTSMLPKDKEMAVRQKIAAELTRGNIDFFVTFEPNAADSAKKINMDLAIEYYQQVSELGEKIGAVNLWSKNPNDLLALLLRMPEVMDAKKQDVITDENWPVVEACIDEALRNINAFRAQEGEVLYKDVIEKVENILAYSKQVEQYELERTEAIREKILSRFAELKAEPDQSRLEQEMIFYIEKLDINEEKVRLRQHCKYFLDTIENEPYPGKKLGFIVPIRIWLADERYNADVRAKFDSDTAAEFFNVEEIKAIFADYIGGNSDNWRKIWTIYTFLVWYDIYFKN